MDPIYNNNEHYVGFDSNDLNAYGGLSKSVASSAYQNRQFTNIEPGITVRDQFGRDSYDAFRPSEATPVRQKDIIKSCMGAYENIGIVRNIIDLMGDFACQGISIVHEDPKIQNFYRQWFKQINGEEKSERFLNYLYRIGNIIVHRTMAKITKKEEKEFKKAIGELKEVEIPIYRREIPWSYEFLNPLKINIDTKNGQRIYKIVINQKTFNKKNVNENVDYLPDYILDQIKNNATEAILDASSLCIHFYKKDDWLLWANPMVHPILDDLLMLQKMRLADIAALDGAISSIRLWNIGSLEHKIVPREPVINKLRDIIASNVGGGTFDLIWGPDLKFQESNTQVHKFLGEEKYKPVLNSIYQGLGISAAVTGSSGNASYTNNYVSIKVLIERLQYGRKVLAEFWNKEFELVRQAMKFDVAASLHFDSIILADEAAVKKSFIDLCDRALISEETLLERFNEIPSIEKSRLKRESKSRKKDMDVPRKAGPYYSPQTKEEFARTALQSQQIGKEYFEELGLPYQKPPMPAPSKSGISPAKKPSAPAGRPLAKKDSVKRKPKVVQPKTKGYDSTSLLLWACDAQSQISEILTPLFLSLSSKKNVRSLSKQEFGKLEQLKLTAFLGLKPYQSVEEASIKMALAGSKYPSAFFLSKASEKIESFYTYNRRRPTIEEIRTIYAAIYTEIFSS